MSWAVIIGSIAVILGAAVVSFIILYEVLAKGESEKARKMRLKRTDWEGIPLPTGKKDSLIISRATLEQYPHSLHQINKIMFDRGRDLGVDISIGMSKYTGEMIVTWTKA